MNVRARMLVLIADLPEEKRHAPLRMVELLEEDRRQLAQCIHDLEPHRSVMDPAYVQLADTALRRSQQADSDIVAVSGGIPPIRQG